ncbi:MAG: peptide chain release factor 1 [Chlamydiales bacterium]|nr:peptide chain release factor 1 [Chlamydiales bacterium]
METKVQRLLSQLGGVEAELGHSEVLKDQKRYRALTQTHSYLSTVKQCWDSLVEARKQIEDNRTLLKTETDRELTEMLRDDVESLEARVVELEQQLERLLVPPDPNDNRNTIIELRAGTGGDEAALFVGDCIRMYKLFADRSGWKYEHLSCTPSEVGGYKEYVMVVSGENAYRYLKHEAGTHRVQRVPATEAQGRVHTSAITIAVLMEPDETEEIKVEEKDLRVDTYRSSGAGGQHVNTTDSAVRLTHIPTGVVVYCQEERSQHKNKAKALRLLQARLAEAEEQKRHAELSSTRASQVGSGDRSERIRTYNFPQNRLTDHRINLTKHNLDQVMEGQLDEVVQALVAHYHQQKLQSEETSPLE